MCDAKREKNVAGGGGLCGFVVVSNVTKLGDLLDFGPLFKAFHKILFAQISHILMQFLSKSIIFLVKLFLGNFYRHLAIFFWSHW